MFEVPCKLPAVERFAQRACELSAADGLVLLSSRTNHSPRTHPPTAAAYCPNESSPWGDTMFIVTLFTASDCLVSPPTCYWPSLAKTDYARVSHAALLPRSAHAPTLEDCLILWYTEECMDDRPVSMLARALGLRAADGSLVQGPVIACAFGEKPREAANWYGVHSPMLHGAGAWVHVPTLSKCVRAMRVHHK